MIRDDLVALMQVPGLSGHEDRVRAAIKSRLPSELHTETDVLGNLSATIPGAKGAPSVMLFTHMDQLGFIVRQITNSGFLRVERLGGVPERALAAQAVLICAESGPGLPGVIANKSHHATGPDEKYTVLRAPDLLIDAGFASKAEAEAAGVRIGTPIVYAPRVLELAGGRIAGTAVDDRAGCAVLLDIARRLKPGQGPNVHLVWSVQEEFNLRGAQVAAQALAPDIAIQIDLMMASDTPDMAERGDMHLGGGPGMSLYSFHGRGTLNGVIPHPALVRLFEQSAVALAMPLQRSAQVGVLTDLSYVQLVGKGVAALDLGFPMRYSHSALETCDPRDLEALADLLLEGLARIGPGFDLTRGGD